MTNKSTRAKRLAVASERERPVPGKPRRYLRTVHLKERYGGVNERTIVRRIERGELPPPDFYQGRFPHWSEDALDAWDKARAREEQQRREAAVGLGQDTAP